jgi:hypothetical protein
MLVTAVESFTVSRANRDRLVELAAKHRLPAMFSLSDTAETGGLISYSADPVDCQIASNSDPPFRVQS